MTGDKATKMAGKFTLVQNPEHMSDGELRAALADKPDSVVMRSLLMAEIEAVRSGAKRERRTMRNVWYDIVKPALSRAGILNAKTRGDKPVPWDAKLSKYLAELVREGVATYEELQIVDGSRQRQAAVAITATVASVQLVGPHFPWVILFTEKDTIWGEIESLAELYGVSAISGGGQPSNACTENTVRAIVRSKAYREAQPEEMILLALTDYDPFGYHIADAQFDQVVEVASAVPENEAGNLTTVVHKRLGLTPDQLTPEERQVKAYEPKDQGLERWFAETGGVDGQRLGLELDALPLSRLRRMFAEGIEQYVDIEKRRDDLRESFVDLVIYDLLQPDFEAKRGAMHKAVKANGLWQAVIDTPIPDDLFVRAAVAGRNCIHPIDDVDLFESQRAQLAAALGVTGGPT